MHASCNASELQEGIELAARVASVGLPSDVSGLGGEGVCAAARIAIAASSAPCAALQKRVRACPLQDQPAVSITWEPRGSHGMPACSGGIQRTCRKVRASSLEFVR